MGRTTGWSRSPHLIQYLLQTICEGAEEYYSKIGSKSNRTRHGTGVGPGFGSDNILKQEPPSRAMLFWRAKSGEKYQSRPTILTIPPAQLSMIVYIPGEPPCWGRRPHLIQYSLQMICEGANEYCRKRKESLSFIFIWHRCIHCRPEVAYEACYGNGAPPKNWLLRKS